MYTFRLLDSQRFETKWINEEELIWIEHIKSTRNYTAICCFIIYLIEILLLLSFIFIRTYVHLYPNRINRVDSQYYRKILFHMRSLVHKQHQSKLNNCELSIHPNFAVQSRSCFHNGRVCETIDTACVRALFRKTSLLYVTISQRNTGVTGKNIPRELADAVGSRFCMVDLATERQKRSRKLKIARFHQSFDQSNLFFRISFLSRQF